MPNEDTTPGAAPVAVLGYTAWQSRFGEDPGILGRTIRLNETPFTIIGVGPKGFKGVYAIFDPDLWLPSMMAAQVLPAEQRNAQVIARCHCLRESAGSSKASRRRKPGWR